MRPPPTRLLMTADAVGGVWTYALDLAAGLAPFGVETTLAVLGPAPAPLSILNEQHRHHLVAKAAYRSALTRFVRAVKGAPAPKSSLRILLDVDPWAML